MRDAISKHLHGFRPTNFSPIHLCRREPELPVARDIKTITGIEAMRTEAVATPDVFDVPTFINSRRVGAVQYGIIILCGLVMFLDGFDTQAISYMVPLMAKEWGLSRELLGPIFSSALTGLMVGYLVLSPLSDRFGHRRLIIISTVAFALLTLITVLAAGVTELIALRFTTGIALGAAIPSAVALTTEYSPNRLRATFVLAIYCGFSLGFVAAGAMAAWIIPLHGWRALLWMGAIAPLTLAVFVFIFLPESLDFLIRTRAEPERIWRVVRRLDATLPDRGPRAFTTEAEAKRGREPVSIRANAGNAAAVAGVRAQPRGVLRAAKLAADHSDRSRPFAEHGRARHIADDGRRHRRGFCHRTGDGPAGSIRVARRGLFCGRGVRRAARSGRFRAFLGIVDRGLLRRVLHQRRSEERHCAGRHLLSCADPLDRRGLGSRYRQAGRHRRPAAGRRAAGLPAQRRKPVLCGRCPHAVVRSVRRAAR